MAIDVIANDVHASINVPMAIGFQRRVHRAPYLILILQFVIGLEMFPDVRPIDFSCLM
jgi:hypothetical protein